jgi:hypothetical protein
VTPPTTFNRERQRALALLARSPNGRTETFMLLHGCTRQQLDGLISAGLATATEEQAGHGWQTGITRIRITEAGRAALSKSSGHAAPSKPSDPSSREEHSSIPSVDSAMHKANSEAKNGFGARDERRKLVAEIMALSPPPTGNENRARAILRNFTLNQLEVLAAALRDGDHRDRLITRRDE